MWYLIIYLIGYVVAYYFHIKVDKMLNVPINTGSIVQRFVCSFYSWLWVAVTIVFLIKGKSEHL